ncbi:hypothetical protein ACIBTV_13810 [Micromonospora sp. NPDC049366]|uniref:hypothetical protein n=1 Tax=Micromonospora sp. NPDC049366 TaxID=3364271 RepID=UPI0037A4E52F
MDDRRTIGRPADDRRGNTATTVTVEFGAGRRPEAVRRHLTSMLVDDNGAKGTAGVAPPDILIVQQVRGTGQAEAYADQLSAEFGYPADTYGATVAFVGIDANRTGIPSSTLGGFGMTGYGAKATSGSSKIEYLFIRGTVRPSAIDHTVTGTKSNHLALYGFVTYSRTGRPAKATGAGPLEGGGRRPGVGSGQAE